MSYIQKSHVDFKLDSSLLDSKFDGYKLSLDPFPIYSHPLDPPVRELQTSNTQYGFKHSKLFSDINYLTYDPFSSNSTNLHFMTVLQDLQLCLISFDTQTKKFLVRKHLPHIVIPTVHDQIDDRYPITISFPNANYAFVSNGFGHLTLYNTGNRWEERTWEECLSVDPLLVDGVVNSFVILESRCVENKFDILLRSVIPGKKPSSHGNFVDKAVWLTVDNKNGKMEVSGIRSIICSGHIEMITFDETPESLIIVATGEINFCEVKDCDCSDINNEEERNSKVEATQLKKKYAWSQTATDVTAVFTCSETVSKKDISLSLSATSIHLSVKDIILISGTLGGSVDPTSSTYTVDNNKIELFLCKSEGSLTNWLDLVLGDNQGTYEIDTDSLNAASELLERFTCESQVSVGFGDQSFNTEQMEDCDVSADDICRICWLNCSTMKWTHESDITTHNVLFSVPLYNGPRFLCIRMDVDGILWKFTKGSEKVKHHATFSALGYVQASKIQRRFTTCPADCSYAVIVEAKRHAFVYWQLASITSDLRNRKTSKRVVGVAKQQLISLTKVGTSGDVCAVTENIVGTFAADEFLFILTTSDIFVVLLKYPFSS
ncbi:unnamed protein product [Thelazia callipaeda]|uniref:NudC domain-containing protein 1 n=1 Tax=Thelazia callipaeda TaxID=103827 RepID=A0A0N5D0K3_THECL|nr:unnamed protein product [Thelazia callipaeda]